MEYCEGGDLMNAAESYSFEESEAIFIFLQLLNGFKNLVDQKIIHRDFKLDNVLVHNGLVKIADFGFSKILDDSSFTETILGSPLNMAPEIIKGHSYNNKVDIWSLGSCLFYLIFKDYPFRAHSLDELQKIILKGKVNFPQNSKVHPDIIDVLKKMLVVDPTERIDWDSLFAHPINQYIEKSFVINL